MKLEHLTNPEQPRLQEYADAATFMGKKRWVMMCNQWLLNFSKSYFLCDDGKKAFLKRKRRAYREEHGRAPEPEIENFTLSPFPLEKIRLLDVGSCYNPLVALEGSERFDITGG